MFRLLLQTSSKATLLPSFVICPTCYICNALSRFVNLVKYCPTSQQYKYNDKTTQLTQAHNGQCHRSTTTRHLTGKRSPLYTRFQLFKKSTNHNNNKNHILYYIYRSRAMHTRART
jgi:hypothetical protein